MLSQPTTSHRVRKLRLLGHEKVESPNRYIKKRLQCPTRIRNFLLLISTLYTKRSGLTLTLKYPPFHWEHPVTETGLEPHCNSLTLVFHTHEAWSQVVASPSNSQQTTPDLGSHDCTELCDSTTLLSTKLTLARIQTSTMKQMRTELFWV